MWDVEDAVPYRAAAVTWGAAVDSRRAGMKPRPYEGAAERGGVGGDRVGGMSRTLFPTGFLHILGFRENIRLRSCSG